MCVCAQCARCLPMMHFIRSFHIKLRIYIRGHYMKLTIYRCQAAEGNSIYLQILVFIQ